ncbi:hypothetical protein HGRIS_014460 [Hohenbuehelia grisea]|uniref:Uncharacterized protein n=1 Tax=Hohenbuehelia grisea TaxID=104357 RepID=A0ABR3JTH3_9AGAR
MLPPIFSASHSTRYDALAHQPSDFANRPRWKTVRGSGGYYIVPSSPVEMETLDSRGNEVELERMVVDNTRRSTLSAERLAPVGENGGEHVRSGGRKPTGRSEGVSHQSLPSVSHKHGTTFSRVAAVLHALSLSRLFAPSSSSEIPLKSSKMASLKPHTWISLWFLVTVPVIFWDVGYCFMRPRSMKGGDLHWIWSPYAIYQNIDLVYGLKALNEGSGFTNAQSFLNVIETLLNIVYLYLAHVVDSPAAIVVGFASAVMTLSKTVLYWAQEYFCNYCAVGHNSLKDLIVYWILPNGLWIVIPAFIVRVFAKEIAGQLYAADRAAKKAALEKRK